MARSNISDHISLLHGYYHFLYIGKFLEDYIKSKDLSRQVENTTIQTGEKTKFVLQKEKIQTLLIQIKNNPDKPNVFGYMIELNAIKGIISIIKELIDTNSSFEEFLHNKLEKQMFPFEQVIRFSRNVLSHAIDPQIIIKQDDFLNQKAYLQQHRVNSIHFAFKYSDYIQERSGSKEYWIDIKINFNRLKSWTPLYTAIPLHQLYLLCELCYNLTKLYK